MIIGSMNSFGEKGATVPRDAAARAATTREPAGHRFMSTANFFDQRTALESGKAAEDSDDALDAIMAPRFDAKMFCLQVVVHLFWPLSNVFYPWWRFPNGLRNQQLVFFRLRSPSVGSFFGFLIQIGPLICWGLLAVFFAYPANFSRSTVTVDEIFYIPMLMMTARIVAIGVKYATLSKCELERFMSASRDKAIEYTNQMQLLSGFFFLRDDVIDRELRTAAEKLGLRLEHLRFENEVDDDARSDVSPSLSFDDEPPEDHNDNAFFWDKFVGARGDRSFVALAQKLLRKSKASTPYLAINFFGFVVASAVVSVPILVRVALGEDQVLVGDSIVMAAFAVASVLTWMNVWIVCLFLASGTVHDYRRALVLKWYTRLIRYRDVTNSEDVLTRYHPKGHFPRITICQRPLDAVSWVQGRSILGTWAFRYERRAEYYLVLVTGVLLAGLVSFFLKLLSGDSSEKKHLLLQSRTWVLLFMILVLMTVLALSALFAALANETAANAMALFAHRRLELQANRCSGGCAIAIQGAEDVLSVASDQLEILNAVYDARVFGMRADGGMVLSFVSFGVTFYAFVFFLLFDIDAR